MGSISECFALYLMPSNEGRSRRTTRYCLLNISPTTSCFPICTLSQGRLPTHSIECVMLLKYRGHVQDERPPLEGMLEIDGFCARRPDFRAEGWTRKGEGVRSSNRTATDPHNGNHYTLPGDLLLLCRVRASLVHQEVGS